MVFVKDFFKYLIGIIAMFLAMCGSVLVVPTGVLLAFGYVFLIDAYPIITLSITFVLLAIGFTIEGSIKTLIKEVIKDAKKSN